MSLKRPIRSSKSFAMTPTIAAAGRRVLLNPHDPDFFNNPYPAYHAIRAEAPASG